MVFRLPLSGGLALLLLLSGCGGSRVAGPQGPPAPTGVTAVSGSRQVTLAWNPSPGATSYVVEWGLSPVEQLPMMSRQLIQNASSPCLVTGLHPGLTCYFEVVAVNDLGWSPGSAQVTATPPMEPAAPPTAIFASAGDGRVALTWVPSELASSYNLYWGIASAATLGRGNPTSCATWNTSVAGLRNGLSYSFLVTAVNELGESAASPVAMATPMPGPEVLASGLDGPYGLALDATSVYWLEAYSGTLKKLPVAGGSPLTLAQGLNLAAGPGDLRPLAVDANAVYWQENGTGAVRRTGLAGGPVTLLAAGGAFTDVGGICLDATRVYWCSWRDAAFKAVPKAGGGVLVLTSGVLRADWPLLDGTTAYALDSWDGSLLAIPLAGAPVTVLASGLLTGTLALDADFFYWTDRAGTVNRLARNGGAPDVLASGFPDPGGLAVDAANLYWADFAGGVWRMPKAGGAPMQIAPGPGGSELVLDAGYVYWACPGTGPGQGTLQRVAK